MPSTIEGVFSAAGLSSDGEVTWGTKVPETSPGVYLVALANGLDGAELPLDKCPISSQAVELLLETRPELRIDGERPNAKTLSERVAGFWLPDEVILYIGLAGTSLRNRVGQYYKTRLGANKPHAGGWFLKLLSNLDALNVHYAACDDTGTAESAMLGSFVSSVSEKTKEGLRDSERPFPFANLEWPPGTRKLHGITGARGDIAPSISP